MTDLLSFQTEAASVAFPNVSILGTSVDTTRKHSKSYVFYKENVAVWMSPQLLI